MKQGQTRAVLTICIASALAAVCASTVPASRWSAGAAGAAGGQLEQAVNLYNQGHYAEAASILSGLDSMDAKAVNEIPPATADTMKRIDKPGRYHSGLAFRTPYVAPNEDWCSKERNNPAIARYGAKW